MVKTLQKLSHIYKKYEALLANVDTLFNSLKKLHKDCVSCNIGCNDCCYAVFDLSFIEATYINMKFNYIYKHGYLRSNLLEYAASVDRKIAKIKKDFFIQTKDSLQQESIINELMDNAAKIRIKCPLLDEEGKCIMYEHRPITCRLYGVPTAIGNKTYVCGKTGFNKGGLYPTIYIEKIQSTLELLSFEAQKELGSKFTELHKVYVPMSMALLTTYDDKYLGVSPVKETQ